MDKRRSIDCVNPSLAIRDEQVGGNQHGPYAKHAKNVKRGRRSIWIDANTLRKELWRDQRDTPVE
jgi:hypothetical protein